MSQFLGPIHNWMYEKVKHQDQVTNYICEKAKEYGWNANLKETLDSTYGEISQDDLETIIDVNNIHGWLSHSVDVVESRFAAAVHILLEANKDCFEDIQELCFEMGQEAGKQCEANSSCGKCYEVIRGYLVDGMPCDGGTQVETDEEDQIVWSVSAHVHEPYWTAQKESLETFFILRDAWLRGFFEGKMVQYIQLGTNTFCVKEG